jgi:23S rRNA (adenine2030-N6)-methyltransferase
MLGHLKHSGVRRQLRIEQAVRPDSDGHGMTAAGLWVINPPFLLDEVASETLPFLHDTLNQGEGFVRVELEVGE